MGDNGGGSHFDALKNTVRKKRSLIPRRPRTEGFNLFTPSDDIPAFDTNPRRKEFSLSHCISRPDSQTGNNDSLQREATDLGERKRMKLKIGGVSRLAHANGSPRKSSKPVNATTNNHLEVILSYFDKPQVVIEFYHPFALSIFCGKCHALFSQFYSSFGGALRPIIFRVWGTRLGLVRLN